jgi:hypothetical protein
VGNVTEPGKSSSADIRILAMSAVAKDIFWWIEKYIFVNCDGKYITKDIKNEKAQK